jgi:drug/metabolite transporter (DMT)-like permease
LDLIVFGAMLVSAFLHAGWNAWVKSRQDTHGALCALVIGAGFPNLAAVALVGLPAPAAWSWIALSVALNVVALNLLTQAYRQGDFAVAYPLIRGLVPLVLALSALPLFGERPAPSNILGIGCVSGGLALLAWEAARRSRTITPRGLIYAAVAACLTAAYVLCDAKGARLGGNPIAYAGTIAVANAVFMALVQALRGQNVTAMLVRHADIASIGAVVSMISYLIFIWSLTQAPVALVATLRETSALFAVGLGATMLGERVGLWRWASVAVMVAGIVLIRL